MINEFASMLTQPDEKEGIPSHAKLYLEIIGRLGPQFYMADQETPEQFLKRTEPKMRDLLMDLSDGKKRMYLPVNARILWLRELYPYAFIFPFIIEHDKDRPCTKLVKTRKEARDTGPDRYEEVEVHGYAHCGCVIFTGRGSLAIGDKVEDAAGFGDYLEKAITGAIGRAASHLGFGTLDVGNQQEEGIPVDSPVPEQALVSTRIPTRAPLPASNGHTPVSNAGKKIEDAPLAGSRDVTTQVTVAPTSKINRDAIKDELKTLLKPLSEEGRHQLTAYRVFQGIPKEASTWNDLHYTQALQVTKDWLSEESAHPEQLAMLDAYMSVMNRVHIQQLSDRLCGKITMKTLPRVKMAYLLALLAKGVMLYELANQVDPEFAYLIKAFKVVSPLQLLHAERTAEEGTWEAYTFYLKKQVKEQGKTPSEPFLKKYGTAYTEWLSA